MKIQFEMTIDLPEELEQEIAQDKEKYMQELLEVMKEGARAEKVPMSVRFIDANAQAIEYLGKVKEDIISCVPVKCIDEDNGLKTHYNIVTYQHKSIDKLLAELKGEKDDN